MSEKNFSILKKVVVDLYLKGYNLVNDLKDKNWLHISRNQELGRGAEALFKTKLRIWDGNDVWSDDSGYQFRLYAYRLSILKKIVKRKKEYTQYNQY